MFTADQFLDQKKFQFIHNKRNNQKIHDLELSQELTRVEFNDGLMRISFESTIGTVIERLLQWNEPPR